MYLETLRSRIDTHAKDTTVHVTADEKSLWNSLASLFELVDIGTEESPLKAIRAKYGLFSDSFLSARGSDPEAGQGGIGGLDIDAMWDALAESGTQKINASHIPLLQQLSGTLTNAQLANSSLSVAGVSVPLGGSVSTEQIADALGLGSNAYTSTEYLPLAGGTMTGEILMTNSKAFVARMATDTSNYRTALGWRSVASGALIAHIGYWNTDHSITLNPCSDEVSEVYNDAAGKYNFVVGKNRLTYNAYPLLHSGNYTNYTVTKTGVGASGTWPISVSGTATYATVLSNNSSTNVSTYLRYRMISGQTTLVGSNAANGAWCLPTTGGDAIYGNGQILRFGWSQSYYTDLHTGPNEIGSGSGLQFRQVIAGTVSSLGWRTLLDTANYSTYLDSRYLLKSSYTASDILAKLKTVDGSGSGLDADLLDGLHASNFYAYGYTMFQRVVDASGLDQNTWYPVTFSIGSHSNVRIECRVSLNSGTKPSWSTHNSGFSVRKIWEVNGSGWGTNPVNRRILVSDYQYASSDPVRGIGQNINSSIEYVYVRGGGKYYFYVSHNVDATLRTSSYTSNGVTISVLTSAPAAISRNVAYVTDNVASATKLATARLLWGQSFNGTGNVSGDMTGVGRINNALILSQFGVSADNSDTTRFLINGHKLEFGGPGYAHQSYYFRPQYSANGATYADMFIQNASAAASPVFSTTHYFDHNGNAYHWGNLGLGTTSFNFKLNVAGTGYFSGLLRLDSGVQIGSTSDIGWYLNSGRIVAGQSVARGVNVGSLLVSGAWADYTKVPTNGIYSKGDIYSMGAISCRGADSQAADASSGIDSNALWNVLGAVGTEKINASHLPDSSKTLTCSTAAGTAAKVVTCTGFQLTTGAAVTVRFTSGNSAASPTLNVNGTGAKGIRVYRGTSLVTPFANWNANVTVELTYNGTYWVITGNPVVYSLNAASASDSSGTYYRTARIFADGWKEYAFVTNASGNDRTLAMPYAFSSVNSMGVVVTLYGTAPGAGNVKSKSTSSVTVDFSTSTASTSKRGTVLCFGY